MCKYCHEPLNLCSEAYKAMLTLGDKTQNVAGENEVVISKLMYTQMREKCAQYDIEHPNRYE